MPRNQHRALGMRLEGSARDSKKFTSCSNTSVYNLIQSRELMGIEDHPIPVKPNSPNIKRKNNFPRDMMPRGGIRVAINFHPFHKGQGERRDALIWDTQSVIKKEVETRKSCKRWEMESQSTPHLGQRGHRSREIIRYSWSTMNAYSPSHMNGGSHHEFN